MISATTTDAYVDLKSKEVHAAILCDDTWETICGISICYETLTEGQEDVGRKEPEELQQIKLNHSRSDLTCEACRKEIDQLFE